MPAFTGQLNANQIFASNFNMIISQLVYGNNIGKHQTLVDKARVDGTLYGDTKLYYSTDVLGTQPWAQDGATNVLELHRPNDPEVQGISIDTFRQIPLTVDYYLTKQAWIDEYAFSSFNSIMLGWLNESKKVYDGTTYNTFIGNTVATGSGQSVDITLTGLTGNERAQKIAADLADLFVKLEDYSREFNDYGNLRSYSLSDVKIIWNSKYVNEIRKIDLPTLFHKDGLMDKFAEEVLPARYFGTSTSNSNTVRAMVEMDVATAQNAPILHLFPGDEILATYYYATAKNQTKTNGKWTASSISPQTVINTGTAGTDFYYEDDTVICKVVVELPPYMSGFSTETSFFNPRSLTENHYLTFGHNSLEYLKNYPFITVFEQ